MRFNIWDLIDKVEDWWPWHGKEGTEGDNVNPDLNPVLLIPGIGGSIINAVNEKGKKERIWVRLFAADHEFRTKLWSLYNKKTGAVARVSIVPIPASFSPSWCAVCACCTLTPSLVCGCRYADQNLMAFITGKTDSIDTSTTIEIPEDRYGLYACDVLDPDVVSSLMLCLRFHSPSTIYYA